MSCDSNWNFTLVQGGSFTRVFELKDDDGDLFDVAGSDPRILVKFQSVVIQEWTIADGQLELINPTSEGKIRFHLTAEEIEEIDYTEAVYYFFLNGEDDLLFDGQIEVR